MMTDPIADMLTRIRNASMAHKKEAVVPSSKIKMAIATILWRAGYLAGVEEIKDKPGKGSIVIALKYEDGQSAIRHLKRISKPGGRCYVKRDEIKAVLGGYGLSILSTPLGILSNKEARKANVGGELICEVY